MQQRSGRGVQGDNRTRLNSLNETNAGRREVALLIGVHTQGSPDQDFTESLDELALLTDTAGADVVARVTQNLPRIQSSTYVGSGKVKEIAAAVEKHGVDLLVVNDDLTTVQTRNLNKMLRGREDQPQDHRPLGADPGHLRPPRALLAGAGAGRARPARVPQEPPHARVDAPRAPEGRHRHAWPGRDADRDRPPHDRQAHLGPQGAPRKGGPAADDAAQVPHGPDARRARRLHQRRQVHA